MWSLISGDVVIGLVSVWYYWEGASSAHQLNCHISVVDVHFTVLRKLATSRLNVIKYIYQATIGLENKCSRFAMAHILVWHCFRLVQLDIALILTRFCIDTQCRSQALYKTHAQNGVHHANQQQLSIWLLQPPRDQVVLVQIHDDKKGALLLIFLHVFFSFSFSTRFIYHASWWITYIWPSSFAFCS